MFQPNRRMTEIYRADSKIDWTAELEKHRKGNNPPLPSSAAGAATMKSPPDNRDSVSLVGQVRPAAPKTNS